ncbi:MAG: DUF493 domain-containing protein [Gammaproteobacteria bacterium]|nr:DUF493 domain-containing protein [Gammaproteobacteria bacterium]
MGKQLADPTEKLASEETLLQFPCEFPVKAMGRHSAHFTDLVVATISQHAGTIETAMVSCRPSRNGNYSAVTVTITATSKQQLDAIYIALNSLPDVQMTL